MEGLLYQKPKCKSSEATSMLFVRVRSISILNRNFTVKFFESTASHEANGGQYLADIRG